jgi:hypothetical protein
VEPDPLVNRLASQETALLKKYVDEGGASVTIACATCSCVFTEASFSPRRILEAPFENWFELSTSASCHGEFDTLLEKDPMPKPHDLFLRYSLS